MQAIPLRPADIDYVNKFGGVGAELQLLRDAWRGGEANPDLGERVKDDLFAAWDKAVGQAVGLIKACVANDGGAFVYLQGDGSEEGVHPVLVRGPVARSGWRHLMYGTINPQAQAVRSNLNLERIAWVAPAPGAR